MPRELNKEQLTALSNILFDVAKGSFALAVFPVAIPDLTPFQLFIKSLLAIMGGVAFTYVGLVILSLKARIKT